MSRLLPRYLLVALSSMGLGSGQAWAAAGGVSSVALRELATDRPDSTESPYTVDPGHLQLEMDVASFTRTRLDGVRTTEWNLAPFNLRYGLTPQVEVGVFFSPHLEMKEKRRDGSTTKVRGVGDTTFRAKFNLLGNDGGPVAFGVFTDLKVPTAADGLGNEVFEGAVVFPVAYEIGAGWEGGAMTAVEMAQTDRGRRAVWVNTITFARELAPDLGCYLEVTSAVGDGAHVATFNCGLTRRLGPLLQIDGGVNIGISRTAPDLTVFAGLSRKF